MVDSGHEPTRVILTGNSMLDIARGIEAGLDENSDYNKIQVLPSDAVEEYLEKHNER